MGIAIDDPHDSRATGLGRCGKIASTSSPVIVFRTSRAAAAGPSAPLPDRARQRPRRGERLRLLRLRWPEDGHRTVRFRAGHLGDMTGGVVEARVRVVW